MTTTTRRVALIEALSALDRAAKAGAIHPNAAARRKSRLTRKVNAALGGASLQSSAQATKVVGRAAAAKAAKARIAAGKAGKAKGAQTAAGKARAASEQDGPSRSRCGQGRCRGERRHGGRRAEARREDDDEGQDEGGSEDRRQGRSEGRPQEGRRGAKGHGQGRAEGEEARRYQVVAGPRPGTTRRTPRHRRGVSECRWPYGVSRRGIASIRCPHPWRVVALGGTCRTAPRRPRPPSVVSMMMVPAVPELLLPVELRERRRVGHAAASSSAPRPASR